MKIEILGSGCPSCKKLEENVKTSIQESNLDVEIIKITDITKFVDYDIMQAPALIIDGQVKCSGRIPDVEEIKKWLK